MRVERRDNYFLLVGAPGTGKTTIIEKLRGHGLACYEEAARFVLCEQLATQGPALPSKDPLLFIRAMQARQIKDFEDARSLESPVLFDRGMPDLVHYAIRFNVPSAEFVAAATQHQCNRTVFLFRPWREIYVNDHVRPLPFEKTAEIDDLLVRVYKSLGYDFIDVPFASPEARQIFIREKIDALLYQKE